MSSRVRSREAGRTGSRRASSAAWVEAADRATPTGVESDTGSQSPGVGN